MEMNQAIALYQNQEGLHDLALDLQIRVTQLADMATFFSDCANQGKMLVPVSNAMPFVGLLGDVCVGWMLFQQAGIAAQKLNALYAEARIDTGFLSIDKNIDTWIRTSRPPFMPARSTAPDFSLKIFFRKVMVWPVQ